MKNMEDKETKRLWFTVAFELYKDFENFCNGASFADGLRALLAHAAQTGFAPFGINKEDK